MSALEPITTANLRIASASLVLAPRIALTLSIMVVGMSVSALCASAQGPDQAR